MSQLKFAFGCHDWRRDNDVPLGRSAALSATLVDVTHETETTSMDEEANQDEEAVAVVRIGERIPSIIVKALVADSSINSAKDDGRVATNETGRKLRLSLHRAHQEDLDSVVDDARVEFLVSRQKNDANQKDEERGDDSLSRFDEDISANDGTGGMGSMTPQGSERVTEHSFCLESGQTIVQGLSLPSDATLEACILRVSDISRLDVRQWSESEAAVFPECCPVELRFKVATET